MRRGILERMEPGPRGEGRVLHRLVGIHRLSDGRERDATGGIEVILQQLAERGPIAGPRKCHEANEFRVGHCRFGGRRRVVHRSSGPDHQHRQGEVGRVHTS